MDKKLVLLALLKIAYEQIIIIVVNLSYSHLLWTVYTIVKQHVNTLLHGIVMTDSYKKVIITVW